jgi:hypothetical protein
VLKARTEGWVSDRGRPLSRAMFGTLLRSEAMIGNFVWGNDQRQPRIARGGFCRHVGVVPRIIDDGTWALVQAKLASAGWLNRSSEDLLLELKLALQRNPGLTTSDLAANGCATKSTYRNRFGSWQVALEAGGAQPTRLAKNACVRSREMRAAVYSYGRALEGALVHLGVPARFDGKFSVLWMGRTGVRIRLLWPVVRAGGRRLWHVEAHHCGPEVEHVLFVRMEASGVPIDFFLVGTPQLPAGFPRWLAREVPTALHEYWSQSRPLLLKRLGGLQERRAGASEGRGRSENALDGSPARGLSAPKSK